MMRRIVAAASAFFVAIVGLSLTTASAASFTLSAEPTVYFDEISACAEGTADGRPIIQTAAADTSTEVAVSDIPSDCHDMPLEVFVYNSAGELIAAGSDSSQAGDFDVTVDGRTATADFVLLRIDGWVFPTTWTGPTPVAPSQPFENCVGYDHNGNFVECYVTTSPDWGSTGPNGKFQHFNFNVYATTNHNSVASWTMTVNLNAIDWLDWTPGFVGKEGADFGVNACNLPQMNLRSGPSNNWGGRMVVGEFGPPAGWSGSTLCSR